MDLTSRISYHASMLRKLTHQKRSATIGGPKLRELARVAGLASAAKRRCPWCGRAYLKALLRKAHAVKCPKRPPDADPGLYT